MDTIIAIITFLALIFTAGFCEVGNFVGASISVGVLGIMSVVINKREQRKKP